jgi:hypothetical protein
MLSTTPSSAIRKPAIGYNSPQSDSVRRIWLPRHYSAPTVSSARAIQVTHELAKFETLHMMWFDEAFIHDTIADPVPSHSLSYLGWVLFLNEAMDWLIVEQTRSVQFSKISERV